MARLMVSTVQGTIAFSVGGLEYRCNDHGYVMVEDPHVDTGRVHGFRLATDAEAAKHGPKEELTPVRVGEMSRAQLAAFLRERGEEVPDRIGSMRQRVMEIADEESDRAARGDEPEAEAKSDRKEKKAATETNGGAKEGEDPAASA